jgi:methionyl-tRNA formyltransferase
MARLAELGSGLVVKVVDGIETGEVTAQDQPLDDISYAPKISSDETNIKWHHPALGIDRWIRGLSPEPGAWTTCDDARIGIGPIQLATADYELQPGEIAIEKNHVFVGTGSQIVELGLVKPAGKNWMEASAWARGLRATPKFAYVDGAR